MAEEHSSLPARAHHASRRWTGPLSSPRSDPLASTGRRGPGGVAPDAPCSAVHLRWTPDGVVVVLGEEVDLACRPRLEQVGRLLASWSQRAVVDASAVTFIDVAGLRAVGALARPGRSVLVVSPSACLLRLLRLLALEGRGPMTQALGPREQALVLLAGPQPDGGS